MQRYRYKTRVLLSSTTSDTVLILGTERNMIKNVNRSSCKVAVVIVVRF